MRHQNDRVCRDWGLNNILHEWGGPAADWSAAFNIPTGVVAIPGVLNPDRRVDWVRGAAELKIAKKTLREGGRRDGWGDSVGNWGGSGEDTVENWGGLGGAEKGGGVDQDWGDGDGCIEKMIG